MGDRGITRALNEFAGDGAVRVVIVTGGASRYFNRHYSIPALIEKLQRVNRRSARQWPDTQL